MNWCDFLGSSLRLVFKGFGNTGKIFNTENTGGTENARRRKFLVSSRQLEEPRKLGDAELFRARIRGEACFL